MNGVSFDTWGKRQETDSSDYLCGQNPKYVPVAPKGCPLEMRPPLGLITYLPPYVLSPLSISSAPLPVERKAHQSIHGLAILSTAAYVCCDFFFPPTDLYCLLILQRSLMSLFVDSALFLPITKIQSSYLVIQGHSHINRKRALIQSAWHFRHLKEYLQGRVPVPRRWLARWRRSSRAAPRRQHQQAADLMLQNTFWPPDLTCRNPPKEREGGVCSRQIYLGWDWPKWACANVFPVVICSVFTSYFVYRLK